LSGLAFLDPEDAEATQLDATFLNQSVNNEVKNLLHDLRDPRPFDLRVLGNRCGNLSLGHGLLLLAMVVQPNRRREQPQILRGASSRKLSRGARATALLL
jgi:hypothetical protein